VPGILSYGGLSENDTATGVRLRLQAGDVVLNFMPTHMIEEHLAGVAAMAEQTVGDSERLPYILHRISQVRFVVGCAVPNGFDDRGTILEVLLRLNCELNGLFFLGDSLFDNDAQPLSGSACAAGDDEAGPPGLMSARVNGRAQVRERL
jgi:hypothetical protein